MTETKLYDILQALLPEGLQFVNPYLDTVPLPKGDYAQMNIIDIVPIAWTQKRYVDTSDENKTVTYAYDWQKIYKVQFDFYGDNSFNNCVNYHHNLTASLMDFDDDVNLKTIGEVQNRSFLQENKLFLRRYGFDIDLFIVDTIEKTDPRLENILTSLQRYGTIN